MSGTIGTLTAFTAGDLVISISGDGNDSGDYTDNQASPIVLEELTNTGSIVGEMTLPQVTTIVNGVTEYAISGEYGSSSEGSLQLSANGASLVIMGYGVNAQTFNNGGAGVYGNAALAQSTSVPGGQYTPVARVIADIGYNGTVDTSTALYNVYNTNNPRSVTTVDGTTFYISGQGVKGDTTQGVFVAHDGADSATPIDTGTDTRTAEIINGELYVSFDSKQANGGGIENFGSVLPTGTTTPTDLVGLGPSITVNAADENSVNAGIIGQTVDLSPENYFFASSTVLYVADGGDPKEGTLGDGGLQKWILNDGTWSLAYTLSDGLNLVANTGTAGTTGLIGLTGTVIGGTVYLYATNATIGDLDQTYLYGIADTLNTTTETGESFAILETAAPDTNIRGVSFAPSAEATTPTSTTVSSGVTSSDITVTSGGALFVLNGGTVVSTTVLAGGTETVSAGGVDSGSDIALGGTDLVLGSATGDYIGGVQIVSNGSAVVTNEIVVNGGTLDLWLKGAIAIGATIETGGTLNISGNAYVENSVINGGTIDLQSAKSVLSGSLTFSGAGVLEESTTVSGTFGDLAVISGFGAGDVIDLTAATSVGAAGSAATLSVTTSGGDTYATVSGGGHSETFIFAGTIIGPSLVLGSDGNGGEEITYSPPAPTSTTISSGVSQSGVVITSGSFLYVEAGGTAVSATILAGGSATIEAGGIDSGSFLSSGGNELVLGSATGDQVHGVQLVSAATAVVTNETVYNGGSVELFVAGAIGSGIVVDSGGQLNISGRGTAIATVLSGGTIELQSPKATLSGSLTFSGAGTLEETTTIDPVSAGILFGDQAVISGFGAGDVIDLTAATEAGGAGSAATFPTVVSGGDTYATVSGGGSSETFIFAGTNLVSSLTLQSDGAGGEEIVYGSSSSSSSGTTPPSSTTIIVSGGTTSSGLTISNGYTLDVLSGGTAVATTILSGGSATIAAGGVDSGTTIALGGSEVVIGSATDDQVAGSQSIVGSVVSDTILSGGSVTVQTGGTDSGSVISASGNEVVLGSANFDQVYGTQLVSAATAVVSNETVFNGGAVDLFLAGVTAIDLTVSSGAFLNINGHAVASNTVINGGTLELQSAKATLSGSLTFSGAGELQITGNTSAGYGDQAVISGFTAADVIDISSATSVGAAGSGATLSTTTSGGDTYATVTGGGSSDTFIFDGTTIGASLTLASDGQGGEELLEVACFLPGTHILTDQGEVLVEKLQVGDIVVTASGQHRPLCWIGQGRALATRGRRGAATPLIVRKGALADNVPHRDLRITKGHSLYLDGALIPVEFLVNHRSILWDDRAQEVTVYHLELDVHDVLVADGAAAESYRDDGNRWLFQNANTGWDQPAKAPCAPVLTGGPVVDAVWRRLLDRAGSDVRVPLTDDPDLHLVVDGRRVDAVKRDGGAHVFRLAARPDAVRIVSREVVPQELALARDPRSLGVALRQIVVRQGTRRWTIEADDQRLVTGFHQYERDNGFVWTNGDAVLPMDLLKEWSGEAEIILMVASTTRYIDEGVRQRVA
jgi:autotransporter passenger strand-loop-strand repeat protein